MYHIMRNLTAQVSRFSAQPLEVQDTQIIQPFKPTELVENSNPGIRGISLILCLPSRKNKGLSSAKQLLVKGFHYQETWPKVCHTH